MIRAENLSKHYKDKVAIQNLNLVIERGEIFVLLGHNGAGKTTLINCCLGFMKPTSGQLYINNIDVEKNIGEARKMVAYIPDDIDLYPNLNALENLIFFASLANLRYTTDQLAHYLELAQLPPEVYKQAVGTYSKGMKQKVCIAIALTRNAKVLFLDEPTSSLDPKSAGEFCSIMANLRDNGTTILMASHDLYRSKQLANRIGIMAQGELVSIIDPSNISAGELEKLYQSV